MTASYAFPGVEGAARGRGAIFSRIQAAGMVALLLAIASIPSQIAFATWADHQALTDEWTISGPPCALAADPAAALTGRHAPMTFSYRGARFTRMHADVSCVAAPEKGLFGGPPYTVCQFNAPVALAVSAAGRSAVFKPAPGHAATVTVRGGKISCVVGGWFAD